MNEQQVRIAIAQVNCIVGDLQANAACIEAFIRQADSAGADIVVFPELAVTGYPPEDLLLKPKFIEDNLSTLRRITDAVGDMVAVVGFVDRQDSVLYNAAAIIYQKAIRGIYHKVLLPNYSVFDEKRYFTPGTNPLVYQCGTVCFGVTICEDIWHDEGPVRFQCQLGKAQLVININASPYYFGKRHERYEVIRKRAQEHNTWVVYANLVGGQDELVFDGQSMVVDPQGDITALAGVFKEQLLVTDIAVAGRKAARSRRGRKVIAAVPITESTREKTLPVQGQQRARPLEKAEEIYTGLVLGLHDYVAKNGFKKVVIGLSGGIDSALVACLAADALGSENVTTVLMPSRYTSDESKHDAQKLSDKLGTQLMTIPIERPFASYLEIFDKVFAEMKPDTTEENIQARIRGNILMALSNKFGWLVLTTGNKSEMSTGYATLYGDMAGGFAVIKDVPKTLVYELCRYRNSRSLVIPENILTKAPTAELRHNQKDTDSLPQYEVLDAILKLYIEEDRDFAAIVNAGFDAPTVRKVLRLVDTSEYKRRQSPPGIKITAKALGKDRRMPITNRYNHGR